MKPAAIPTPYEIHQRCLEIQAEWSDSEKERREVGRAAEWRPTVVPELVVRSALNYAVGSNGSLVLTRRSATS